ncbi:helix-turn-helix domain-containing protein [Dyadobacter frigoris]|uniref:Helix-turn-helix domain-containing protein n=1 Tax=Dyadobacter frigoris TaxID=2576211 RepID=A0A4U6CZZ1_9BACT|nr:helix-turn-helix domain-containing protein [Dyadobacter frigoris]TKT90362.1 helix-turn-helix domain-containing protein [Dyadobacter frigoris]GLU52607.1 transcriptional regulator [Dyadobacter frigoris]
MKWQFEDRMTYGQFRVSDGEGSLKGEGLLNGSKEVLSTIVLNLGVQQGVVIDKIRHTFPSGCILPLVSNQHFIFDEPENLIAWQFNRSFYCIADHDAEVGCVGFLFYGIQNPLFVHLSKEEIEGILTIQTMCVEDMSIRDKMQGEMLRTLLKRLIIKITRIAKKQTQNYDCFSEEKMDVIRKFNLLVEANYRKEHEVQFYAQAMNKSPKTLTNIFGLCNYPSPSKLIQRRIISEAKRYLYFTNKSAKEIACELGFTSMAHFSRFFKLNAGINFSEFRGQQMLTSGK